MSAWCEETALRVSLCVRVRVHVRVRVRALRSLLLSCRRWHRVAQHQSINPAFHPQTMQTVFFSGAGDCARVALCSGIHLHPG